MPLYLALKGTIDMVRPEVENLRYAPSTIEPEAQSLILSLKEIHRSPINPSILSMNRIGKAGKNRLSLECLGFAVIALRYGYFSANRRMCVVGAT